MMKPVWLLLRGRSVCVCEGKVVANSVVPQYSVPKPL